jgi:hypothetical protein
MSRPEVARLSGANVRFGSLADIPQCPTDVCFTPKSGHCYAVMMLAGRISTPARPLRRSIGGQGLRGCLRPSRPATWGVREDPPLFLPLRRRRFQSRLSCCRDSREEFFSYPRLCWLGAARQSSQTAPAPIRRDHRCKKRPNMPTMPLAQSNRGS